MRNPATQILLTLCRLFVASCIVTLSVRAHANPDLSKEDLIRQLDKFGITTGHYIWLRYPMSDAINIINVLPGLSKVRIVDIDVIPHFRYASSGLNVIFKVENAGIIYTLDIGKYDLLLQPDDVVKQFFLSDPSKMVAKWGAKILKAISTGNALIGMTKEQVKTSIGAPGHINTSVGRWGEHEQWVYNYGSSSSSSFLYFQNGRLTGWQD